MTVRILFLLSILFPAIEGFTQVLHEDLLKKDGYLWEAKLEKSAKHVSFRSYYDVGRKLKFNIDLLKYSQEGFFQEDLSFDKDGILTSVIQKKISNNTNWEEINTQVTFQRKYNSNGHLIHQSKLSADTILSSVDLSYGYDDKNRVIEIRKVDRQSIKANVYLEEIEYLEHSRKSCLYIETDSSKAYLSEYVYNSNNLLITRTYRLTKINNGPRYRIDYFYNRNGKIEAIVAFGYMPTKSIESGFNNGGYNDYIYNKEGILKKVVCYNLEIENINGNIEYLKGAYKSKSKHKVKIKGKYILQKIMTKRNDKQGRVIRLVILDQYRNVILVYRKPIDKYILEITDITYY